MKPHGTDAGARERFRRARSLFEAASGRTPAEQAAFLANECRDDPSLVDDVEAMLSADRDPSSMLDRPVEESAAALFEARSAFAPGDALGAFCVVRRLGAGGMGTVYLAERTDGTFEQRVAIKLFAASPQFESRFRRERAILARLDHPRIARLVDGGVHDGRQPYFVLEYVDGQPLDAYLRERTPSFRERVELFLEICDAVGYAHRNLVVHRDLKPQNILVTRDGHVKLLDFGIAKLLADDDVLATRTLQSVATPAYAAPEQLTGGTITTATDVWALGALLYQVLSGALPFATRHGRVALEHAILHDDPPRPRSLAPEVPEDLEAIALAALRKEPERRTPSVEALAEDLRRWISLKPVRARGDSRRYRTLRFVQRNRLPLALSGLAVAAATIGVAATAWQARAARIASGVAIAEAERAKLTRDFLVRLFFDANPAGGRPNAGLTARDMLEKAGESLRKGEMAATPDVQADLLELIAWLHGQRGERGPEISTMQAAIAARRKLLPPDHPDLLAARGMLTWALANASRWGEVEAECREIEPLARHDSTPPRPRSIILRACSRLAMSQGRFLDAVSELRAALAPARASDDPGFAAIVAAELAAALTMAGDYDAAHAAAEQALFDLKVNTDLVKVALGRGTAGTPPASGVPGPASAAPDLVRTASVTAIVATVETTRGNFSGAEALLAGALPRVSAALGADHPLTLALRRRQALVLARTDRVSAAVAELEALLAATSGSQGRGNRRESILVRADLAEALLRSGEHARAEQIAAAALADLEPTIPANHLDRAQLRTLLARAFAARGDRAGARRLLEEAARDLAPGHPYRREIAEIESRL
jgi:eukaryotic-like serine/threonine-protein kinase